MIDDSYSNNDNILSINAVEQIRKFISDDKSFFDDAFIESVANIIFSKSIGSKENFKASIKDNITTFAALCLKYQNFEKKFGIDSNLDIIDTGIIQTSIDLSREFLSNNIDYSSRLIYDRFKTVMSDSSRRIILETDQELNTKYNRYLTLKDPTYEDSVELQKFLENKIEIIDVVEQIESFSQFISMKANNCNTLSEFANDFIETVNNISSSLTTSNELNQDVIDMEDITSGEGLSKVIHDTDKIKCGISILDAVMGGGFDRGRIYTFGGQTGGGKSTVLLNILYGMSKHTNGVYFSEYDIYSRNNDTNNSLDIVKQFIDNHIAVNSTDKKKIFLYYTLENTADETVKRLLCRIGLIPNIFWMLRKRDSKLDELLKTKGYNFTIDELPNDMNDQLKHRIYNFAQMVNIIFNKNQLGSIKIIWKAPYSISSVDILKDCKKLERNGYTIDGIFVDYPDKMKSADASRNETDQNWLELGKIIDNLKALAAQVNVPVLTVTQVTRADNKATGAGKLGSSAGSIQKEYNSDTQINMNFNSSENKMVEYFKEFTDQQRRSNIEKQTMFGNLIKLGSSNRNDIVNNSYNTISLNSERSSDIIQMKLGIPTIQKVESYITKNRDSVSKITFDMFIAYGMYLVTDYDIEALNAARYAVESYMLIANYMSGKNFIGPDAYSACVESEKDFINYYNEKMRIVNSNNRMVSMAKKVEIAPLNAMTKVPTVQTNIPQVPNNINVHQNQSVSNTNSQTVKSNPFKMVGNRLL